jgi:hypothetical protein
MMKMTSVENRVKSGLRANGIACQTVYRLPDEEDPRLVIAFPAGESARLTPSKVEHTLNALGIGNFQVQNEFTRLSAAFLHLEVLLGSRTEAKATTNAQ